MQDNKRQNLSVNERKIVELTLQGESQIDIANKLDVAPSTVYRTLRREHIQDMINDFKDQVTQLSGFVAELNESNSFDDIENILEEISEVNSRTLYLLSLS